MAVTYTWSVIKLTTISDDTYQDIVHLVDWEVTGDDGTSQVSATGSTPLGRPERAFTAYADLTEEDVLTWVRSALGELRINEVEGTIAAALTAKDYQAKPLPWVEPKQLTDKATAVPSKE